MYVVYLHKNFQAEVGDNAVWNATSPQLVLALLCNCLWQSDVSHPCE